MNASYREAFEKDGYFIIRGALNRKDDLLARLNAVFSQEIDRHLSDDDRAVGWRGTDYTRDGKYSPLVATEITNDNHRFRFESVNHDMPKGSRFWSQDFIDLVDLPGVVEVVTELVGDESRWGHLGARGDTQLPRLSHHNIFLRSSWEDGAPQDLGGSLHGGNGREKMEKCTISVAYELLDVGAGDGGFSCIPGSHHPSFELPTHDGWRQGYSTSDGRGSSWPTHAELREVAPMQAGDALIFTEHLTHGTLPWLSNKERRTIFFKYTQHGTVRPHAPGNNCAFYDLTDRRLNDAQRFILGGGVWGSDGLAKHQLRLTKLEQLRSDNAQNVHGESTATSKL